MANKVAPKISKPGSHRFPQKGPHNPNVGTSGSGMAPVPKGGAAIAGNDRPSHSPMNGLARVNNRPSSPTGQMPTSGSFMPEQNNAMANLESQQVGQNEVNPRGQSGFSPAMNRNPVTRNPVATHKPQRKGKGAAFYGE